jgi:hypothetical protein
MRLLSSLFALSSLCFLPLWAGGTATACNPPAAAYYGQCAAPAATYTYHATTYYTPPVAYPVSLVAFIPTQLVTVAPQPAVPPAAPQPAPPPAAPQPAPPPPPQREEVQVQPSAGVVVRQFQAYYAAPAAAYETSACVVRGFAAYGAYAGRAVGHTYRQAAPVFAQGGQRRVGFIGRIIQNRQAVRAARQERAQQRRGGGVPSATFIFR